MACTTQTVEAPSGSWSPRTYQVQADPVLVASANANRRGVLVVCQSGSAGACHVADKPNASISVGGRSYPLAVGEGVTINTAAEVYVIADNGATGASVKVIEEFGTPS